MKGMLIMKYTAIFTAASVAALIAGSSAFAQDGLTGVQSLNDRIDDITTAASDELNEQNDPNRFGFTAANAGWKGSLAASASATSGNTKNRDVSIAGRMTYGSGYGAILSALQVNSVPPMALKPRKNCSAHTKPTVTLQLTFMVLPQAARQKISSAHWTQTHLWALVQASVS